MKYLLLGGGMFIGSAFLHQLYNYKSNVCFAERMKKPRLFAWGHGLQGQLGLGTEILAQGLPSELVEIGELTEDDEISLISAASDISAAVSKKGKLFTWGKTKGMGKAERGFTTNLMSPTTVSGVEDEEFLQVACGRTHIAALTKDGRVYDYYQDIFRITWGNPDMGKLGLEMKISTKPFNIREYHPTNYADKAMMGEVKGELEGKKIIQVACGFHHTVCLTENGEVYTFGKGKEGALGLGTWDNNFMPQKVPNLENVKKIDCGSEYTLCLTNDGKIFSWGRNNYGQLGITGNQSNKENKPIQMRLPKEIKVADISCGEEHAAFVTLDGHVYTWGFGHDGQLGHSAKTHLSKPKKIEGLTKIRKVVCGGGHTGLISEDHELYLFGRGRDGQLGRGDRIESIAVSRYEPLLVDYFQNENMAINELALGNNHSLALATNK